MLTTRPQYKNNYCYTKIRFCRIYVAGNHKIYYGLHVQCPILLPGFNQNFAFLDRISHQSLSIKFHGNPSTGSCNNTCRQTDRQTYEHKEAIGAFRDYAKTPKIIWPEDIWVGRRIILKCIVNTCSVQIDMEWLGSQQGNTAGFFITVMNLIVSQQGNPRSAQWMPTSNASSGTIWLVWYWQRETKLLGEKRVEEVLCWPRIWHGLAWLRNRASVTTDWQLTSKLCCFEYTRRCLQNNSRAEILLKKKSKW
jgi:hypothetical protein